VARFPLSFSLGCPLFAVQKYSDALNALREERKIGGGFHHNLVAVDSRNHKATFQKSDGSTVDIRYTFLHATPPMGPLDFIQQSPLADAHSWVSVNSTTLQHTNPEYANVFSLGDCSSLPTSKTAAAITAQTPIVAENIYCFLEHGRAASAHYDGYTSCPVSFNSQMHFRRQVSIPYKLLTGYGELLLAEFKYGLEPKETFSAFVDQTKSHRAFYWLKKSLFPHVYWNYMVSFDLGICARSSLFIWVKGRWFGTKGFSRPSYS